MKIGGTSRRALDGTYDQVSDVNEYGEPSGSATPGRRSRTQMQGVVQRSAVSGAPDLDVAQTRDVAARGVEAAGSPLPHLDRIQPLFGGHDVTAVRAEIGGPAARASEAIGARAYATGDRVAFAHAPDLHTAAHEAAHVVQQRAGVQLAGGVGREGDPFEAHADRVADGVVRGGSVESLLDEMAGPDRGGHGSAGVQRSPVNYKGGVIPGTTEEDSNAFHSALMFKYGGDKNVMVYLEVLELFRAIQQPTQWDKSEIEYLKGYVPGTMPLIGEPQDQEQGKTVAQLVLHIANKVGIKNDVILTLLIEWTSNQIDTAGLTKTLRQSLNHWQAFTACYNTAEILFSQLHAGLSSGEYGATPGDQQSIGNVINVLCSSITANKDGRAIYRIKCGIHGFTILVRHQRAELLQSFAGNSGEMLTTSLKQGKTFSLGDICSLLTTMVCDNEVRRAQAQEKLFNGSIEDKEHKWPNIELSWKVGALLDEKLIIEAFSKRLIENLKTLKTHHRGQV